MLRNTLIPILLLFCYFGGSQNASEKIHSDGPTDILILGTLHFNQFHNPSSKETNFAGKERQGEFLEVVQMLNRFKPDAVFIEREPSKQQTIDSLYGLKEIDFSELSDGMSEVYQIGFKLAKANKLKTVYGVDFYESIPQNLLKDGERIQVFKDSLSAFQNKGRGITMDFLKGKKSISEFLIELNKIENVNMSHRLLFNTPAYVTNGTFKDAQEYDVNEAYIGAEYISLFYNRNLKIYSNILQKQQELGAKRIVLITGQVHVGVLQQLIGMNPNFRIIEVNDFLH